MTTDAAAPQLEADSGTPGSAPAAAIAPSLDPLVTPMNPAKILATLGQLSQRGKLPGYEPREGGFRVRAFGDPFDHWMTGTFRPAGESTRIDLSLAVAPKMPLLTLLVTVLTIQPGMWLTDSMCVTYSSWYAAHIQTWWWYLPLVILPTPFMVWRMWKKSKAAANDHTRELHERLTTALAARPADNVPA